VPEPVPEPVKLDDNVDPIVTLVAGGPEPEDRVLEDTFFEFFAIAADGSVATDTTMTLYGASKGALAAGKYQMRTSLNDAVVMQDIVVGPETELSQPVAVLDAGILNITLRPSPGADIDPDAFWEMRGPNDVTESNYGSGYHVFPAGEYGLLVRLGSAEVTQTVVIEAGKVTDLDLVVGVGLAAVEAYYKEGMMVEAGEHFVEILSAKKDIDGNRAVVAYTYGAGASFDLPAGDYVAMVTLGAVKAEALFAVKVGERVDISVILNAGVAAVTTPDDRFIEVLAVKPDINGNRTSFAYSYGPTWQTTLAAGDYVLKTEKDGTATETPFSVVAGERVELTVTE
jgi:Ca-activated chloride channel family protein